MTQRMNQLKEEISGLFEACTTTAEQLKLVDTLQHLSIDHHFNTQILAVLSSIHGTEFNSTCLHEVSLRFRLLRQQGFWVSPDEFNRFKDENGNFNVDDTNDARGLLSLYNAAYLFTHGEAWWKDLYSEVGLTYSRDRVVECYLWSYTAYYEKEYSRARMILAKIIVLIILTDDTYDVRATLEECRKFNEAIQRWEESAITLLPEYLKKFYHKLMNTFKEFEDELKPHEKCRVAFSIKAFQILSSNYLQEAEWFHGDHKPRFKDQVKVSTVCSGAPFASVGLLVGMGDDVATKEALEWAIGCTDAVKAFAEVTRFMNDLASFKRGRNKMDVATYVECYMNEQNVTSEVALTKIGSFVDDAWKTLNQRARNFAMSMMIIFLEQKDGYTNSKVLEETLKNQFVKHIPL
ncbi:hypothetical protein HU200_017938 [Digitaria exilis]|uniref:Uncharacterized protein n=1 Tax=Digitaria exilis TaxID=1010633 RepID=A0A835F535_9POAL|nr:hypothetical protein HU200_017938 [Digitaria exilis]